MKPIDKTLATLLTLWFGTGLALAFLRLLGETDFCTAILYLLAIVIAVAVIFIWTNKPKNNE